MSTPRILRATILTALLVCLPLISLINVHAQATPPQQMPVASDDKARGLELYRNGNASQAVVPLREAV